MIEGNFSYWTCGTDSENITSEPRIFAVNSGVITTVATSTKVSRYRLASDFETSGETTAETIALTSTVTTEAPTVAMTLAPAVQLVWRPIDRPSLSDFDSSSKLTTTSTSAPNPALGRALPLPAMVGIAAGAVVLVSLLLLGILIYTKRRRERKIDRDQQYSPDASVIPSLGEPTIPAVGLSYKAELDAIATVQRDFRRPAEKPKLPGDGVMRFATAAEMCHELDAGPPLPNSVNTSNPVSPLSEQSASPGVQYQTGSPSAISGPGVR